MGDLGREVNDFMLYETFLRGSIQYEGFPSCRGAHVVTDPVTGWSRGYGFVRFADPNEQRRAVVQMQGQLCGGRPMRISVATPKNRIGGGGGGGCWYTLPVAGATAWTTNSTTCHHQQHDPGNTTVFVGGLVHGYNLAEEELSRYVWKRIVAPFADLSVLSPSPLPSFLLPYTTISTTSVTLLPLSSLH